MRNRLLLILVSLLAFPASARDITFLSTSDCHYRQPDYPLGNHNDLNRATVEEMNRIAGHAWPEKLGGGKIASPRYVLVLGDYDSDRAEVKRKISPEPYGFFLEDLPVSVPLQGLSAAHPDYLAGRNTQSSESNGIIPEPPRPAALPNSALTLRSRGTLQTVIPSP